MSRFCDTIQLEPIPFWRMGHGPLSRYVKLLVAHAPGMPGTFSPSPRVTDSDMHHGTCVTHVPWCMPGSLTSCFFEVGGGENAPGVPGACATRNFTYLVRGPWWVASGVLGSAVRSWHPAHEAITSKLAFILLLVYGNIFSCQPLKNNSYVSTTIQYKPQIPRP